MAAPLDLDEQGVLRGPDGADFVLDDDGILRAVPSGRDSGLSNSANPPFRLDDFDPAVRVEIATPSSGSNQGISSDPNYSDRSQEDWQNPPPTIVGILKRGGSKRRVSPPNTQLTQDIDYCGPVPNNTQELYQTPVHSQNSQNSEQNSEEGNQGLDSSIHSQQQYQKSSSSETQEEREDLNSTLRFDEGKKLESRPDTTADISLSEEDITHLDLTDLERYAELELQNGGGSTYLSNESQKTPATIPTIYLESGQDQYKFLDDSREIDRSSSSLHLPDTTQERITPNMEEDVPIFTGASIPFGESCEEAIGSDAIIQQHLIDAMATKDESGGFMTQAGEIPHSLIEFEALEVQMQIQNQLAQLKEEEDVLGDFLQSTEQNREEVKEDTPSPFGKGDSLPFENTGESEDLKARPSSESPSRIPVAKRRSLTKGGSLRSSTDSLNSNPTGSKTQVQSRKPPSPSMRGRTTPQKKDKENRRPDFKRNSLTLKQPRSDSSTPQSASKIPSQKKGPRPMKAQRGVPSLELTDSMDDSDIEKVKSKLKIRLATEQSKRIQQTDVIKQLQEDYDQLLTKFALAEVTIDQLRLGAKMNLYSDSPTPQTVGPVQQAGVQYTQQLPYGARGQGQMGVMGQGRLRGQQGVQGDFQGSRPHSRGSFSGLTPLSFQDYDEPSQFQDDAFGGTKGESIKIGLLFQARSLSDQMESFQMLLDEDELNAEEQEKVIDKVKADYDKLQSDYRQAKHDSQLMKQHNLLDSDNGDAEFDSEKVIEGELFRLGMKLDDLQQNVEENMRIAKRRTPFQDLARPTRVTNGYGNGRAMDESSTTDLEGDPLDTKWQKLQKDYNALLDLFDRMKRLPKTPERDRDIAALMKKLKYLHGQSPNLLQPLPALPDSDDDTLEGSLFGSTSSVVRATPKPASADPSSRRGDSSRDIRQGSDSGSRERRQESRRRSQSRESRRETDAAPSYRRRSRSSYQDSDGADLGDRSDRDRRSDRPPKAPRPSSEGHRTSSEGHRPSSGKQSDKESTLSRGRRGKGTGKEASTSESQEVTPHKSVRPVELDRDSGFIGSESSRQSQSNVSKRQHNGMSTLTDEDESAHFPYTPAGQHPAPHTWTDSELSSAVPELPRTRNQKRSTTSLVSDSTRGRKSSKDGRRGRTREESETEALSTGRASLKSEKIKSLEGEVEKLKELMAAQTAQAKHEPQPTTEQWDTYPWIRQHSGYAAPDGVADPGRAPPDYPGQTWSDYPYHRRHSLPDSDIPSIDTLGHAHRAPSHSQPRILDPRQSRDVHRRPVTPDRLSHERRLADKNRYNEGYQMDGKSLPPKVPRPKDLERQRERGEDMVGSRDRRTANKEPRSRSMPRRLSYDNVDSPSRPRENLELRRDAERSYSRKPAEQRYRSFDNLSDNGLITDYRELEPRRSNRYDHFQGNEVPSNQRNGYHGNDRYESSDEYEPRSPSPEAHPNKDHEKHYRFFRDLEKGRQHIQKVLENAAENKRKQDEKERKEKRKQPIFTEGNGTLTKTQTMCCPMCKGKGECTHTEVYHLPRAPGHVGMGFAGMSEIPVSQGNVGQSVEQSMARGAQPVPGMQPPGGFVPNMTGAPAVPMATPSMMTSSAPVGMAMPGVAMTMTPGVPGGMQGMPLQPMTSTPYAGGDARPSSSDASGPVIKIPLRLYENRLNTKYVVKEYSDDARSQGSHGGHKHKLKPRYLLPDRPNVRFYSTPKNDVITDDVMLHDVTVRYKPVSSSVPPKDKYKFSKLYSDNDSVISHDDYSGKSAHFTTSLDDAVKLAMGLKKLSGKMKNDVKEDLKRSVRTEHLWKTTRPV